MNCEVLNAISVFIFWASPLVIIIGAIKYFYTKDDKDKRNNAKNIVLVAFILLFLSFVVYASINLTIPGICGTSIF